MKTNTISARNFARSITVTAVVLLLSACGNNPVPVPAPPSGNNYGYGQGMGNCGSVSGAAPVQTTGQTGYYAELLSQNPVSSGDFVMNLFYQKVPTAGNQVENIVGAGAVKIPALTGYLQNSIVPVCDGAIKPINPWAASKSALDTPAMLGSFHKDESLVAST